MIALEPYYDSYAACIAMAGGRRVPVTLRAPDFRLDLDELRAAVTPRTKVLLINSPHNPTGTVLTDEELRGIAALAVEHDLVVITDEVYEHLIYDGGKHRPLAAYAGMADRTVSIGSAARRSRSPAGRSAGSPARRKWSTAVNTSKQFLTYVSGAPVPAGRRRGPCPRRRLLRRPARRPPARAATCSATAWSPSVSVSTARRARTSSPPTSARSATPTASSSAACCRRRRGVVAIPHQVFYDNLDAGRPLVRWAFCKKLEVLEEALNRLTKL